MQTDCVGFLRGDGLHHEASVVVSAAFHIVGQTHDGGVGGDEGIGAAVGMVTVAGPRVIGGIGHHHGAYRVQFDSDPGFAVERDRLAVLN